MADFPFDDESISGSKPPLGSNLVQVKEAHPNASRLRFVGAFGLGSYSPLFR